MIAARNSCMHLWRQGVPDTLAAMTTAVSGSDYALSCYLDTVREQRHCTPTPSNSRKQTEAGGCMMHQLVWVKSKMSLAGTLLPPPTNRLSAYWMCMWRGTVMCHAPHAGTFLEKGWIEEIFNRNRENNKEMNRDNKIEIVRYSYGDN